ncbi:hypothetical protein SBA4_3100006 [Candidatus Sulfopaludibacter sp. SbA4]|nr:hypothetical protein SBA4_3100006 [Candidatus Sulfopaludibacter sp. SbA4]
MGDDTTTGGPGRGERARFEPGVRSARVPHGSRRGLRSTALLGVSKYRISLERFDYASRLVRAWVHVEDRHQAWIWNSGRHNRWQRRVLSGKSMSR